MQNNHPNRPILLTRNQLKRMVWEMRWKELLTLEQCRARLFEQGHGRVVDGQLRPWSYPVISLWWREAEQEAQADFLDRAAVLRAVALSGHLKLYNESLEAWEKSKRGAALRREKKVRTREEVPGSGGAPATHRMVEERSEEIDELRDQYGDPRYLAEARQNLSSLVVLVSERFQPRADLLHPEGQTELDDVTATRILDVLSSTIADRRNGSPDSP